MIKIAKLYLKNRLAVGIEPTTLGLKGPYSTTELSELFTIDYISIQRSEVIIISFFI